MIVCGLTVWIAVASGGDESGFQAVEFKTIDGGHIHASLFEAGRERAVVLAHGAVFNKESWYPLARRLQQRGLTCLAIDFRGYGESSAADAGDRHLDIVGAVAFLKNRGFGKVALLGGSMGGAALLNALDAAPDKIVDKAIILAAPGGAPIRSREIGKLFIISERDPVAPRLKRIYESSAKPRQLEILPGKAHAQHIFKTDQAERLTQLIESFLRL